MLLLTWEVHIYHCSSNPPAVFKPVSVRPGAGAHVLLRQVHRGTLCFISRPLSRSCRGFHSLEAGSTIFSQKWRISPQNDIANLLVVLKLLILPLSFATQPLQVPSIQTSSTFLAPTTHALVHLWRIWLIVNYLTLFPQLVHMPEGLYTPEAFCPSKVFSTCWLGVSILTQNTNITLRKSNPLGWFSLTFALRTRASSCHDGCADVTTISHQQLTIDKLIVCVSQQQVLLDNQEANQHNDLKCNISVGLVRSVIRACKSVSNYPFDMLTYNSRTSGKL